MEVLTHRDGRHHHNQYPTHNDTPMDLSVAAADTKTAPYNFWQNHPDLITLEDLNSLPQETAVFASKGSPYSSDPQQLPSSFPPSYKRGVPTPNKVYNQDRSSPPTCTPPSTLPSLQPTGSPLPSTNSNKRPRVEPPELSDVPSAADPQAKKAALRQEHISSDVHPSTQAAGGERRRPGVIRGPYKEGHVQASIEPRSDPMPPLPSLMPLPPSPLIGPGIASLGEDHARLLTNILQIQASHPELAEAFPPTAVKDPEVILKAMQQSQMLYYSYCTQLIQTLREKQEQALRWGDHHQEERQCDSPQQEPPHHESHYQGTHNHEAHQLESYFTENSQHLSQRSLHRNDTFLHQKSPMHSLKVESDDEDLRIEVDYHSDHEENRIDSRNSLSEVFRTRLDSQESSQSQSPSSPLSPTGMGFSYPSSITGDLLDDDLVQEVSQGCALGRRRAPRALTGKHVRTGTGASTTTLLTLKQKLQQKLQNPHSEESTTR